MYCSSKPAILTHYKRLKGSCTTEVGIQVNVITGSSSGVVGQLNVKNTSAVVSHASKGSDTCMIDIPIKVVNSTNKPESKTYMLEKITSLNCLHEYILVQLGKSVVSLSLQCDVGCFAGIHKIRLVDNDNIKTELKCLHEDGVCRD